MSTHTQNKFYDLLPLLQSGVSIIGSLSHNAQSVRIISIHFFELILFMADMIKASAINPNDTRELTMAQSLKLFHTS